ncbi:MAG TPA: transketolase [Acidimicrobiia bacterium]
MTDNGIQTLAVNTVKALAMDAVQKANSGHPGMPMGMAEIAVTLWSRFLKVDPTRPDWPDRDRFVLSNGHGSMLLYSMLHLAGFPLTMDDIRAFRQWESHTAGHPEIDHRLGIEMTTGPLGQGFATGVGMAIAEAHLRARLGQDLVDHRTFGFVSDGDLMEGVSAEAGSLAGNFGLGRLVYLYDDNDISIDGSTDITFTEDVVKRFRAQGWHTQDIDGHDMGAITEALEAAVGVEDQPSLVVCHTHIAHGAPHAQDTAESHGTPLGDEEIALTKQAMGYRAESFQVEPEVYEFFESAMAWGREERSRWEKRLETADDERRRLWDQLHSGATITLDGPGFAAGDQIATRSASGKLFAEIAEKVPGFIGGSADLVASTKTVIDSSRRFSADDPASRDIPFGVREHAMGCITNGLAVHGGLKPYAATFFVFSDYMRPAVRLSALMDAPSVWVWTHDSVFLGEDGPTHQPIEHLASLRAMPHLWVIRPADAKETVAAWEIALNRSDGPVGLVLTRQDLPVLEHTDRAGVGKGGYILREGEDVTLLATGSEVHVALAAADLLAGDGVSARVASLPCWELFAAQEVAYRDQVLGHAPRVAIEAAAGFGWERMVGDEGLILGIDRFGASAPDRVIAEKLGFTGPAVAARVREHLTG